jgi:predicted Zn-dependent peptidase
MRTTNKIWIALALLLLTCQAQPARAVDLEKKILKAKLPNGLTVLMMERKFSPTVSLYIRYRVGAVDEAPGQSGAAHFLEHMMFKGTTTIGAKNYPAEKKLLSGMEKTGRELDRERRKQGSADAQKIRQLEARLKKLQNDHLRYYIPNEIDRLYTENGASGMNAATGQDMTTYFINLPANKIELWARIESDRLLHPVFRQFYTERNVILEERRQRVEASPDGKLYEAFMGRAYSTHPYGIPIIGLPRDLTFLSPAAIRGIHRKYLSPRRIVVAVVGDIDPSKTMALIRRYFGKIPDAGAPAARIPAEPAQAAERKAEVWFDASPSMIIGYHKPAPPAREDYVFDVLETILSKGRTSRLYDRLVISRQIAQSISAANGVPAARYPNLFTIFARPRHPHTNAELQAAILGEIEAIKTSSVTEEELARAKNQLKMDYIKSLDSNSELASILSYTELLLGDYRYFSGYLPQIQKVTAGDVQAAAIRYLTAENRTVAVLNRKTTPGESGGIHEQ